MKKQIRYIIIAGIILAVLIGALVFLLTMPNKEDESTSTSSSTATTLIEQATGNIEKIVVQNSGGTYTLMGYGAQVESTVESSGETSTVTTTEMVFTMQEHSSYLIDKDKSDALAYDCANLVASKVVNANNNPDSDYGLDKPRATVTVSFSDGSEKTIKVGNDVPDGKSAYIRMGDSNKIYVVALDSVNSMLVEKLQMFDKTILNSLSDDETLSLLSVTGSGRKKALKLEKKAFSNISSYYLSSPSQAACDADKIESLCNSSLFPLVADSVAAIDVKESDLSKYNLDKPYYILDAKTSTRSYKILVSKPDKDENCYIMLNGADIIYKIESSVIDFMGGDGSDIVSKTIFYPNNLKLKSVDVSYGKIKDTYTIENTVTKNEDGVDITTTKVYYNGEETNITLFNKFMKNLSVLERAEKIPAYDEKSNPVLSVSVTYTDDTIDTLEIYKGDKKAIVVLNGKAVGTTELETAEKLNNCAKFLATGTDFDSLVEDENETSDSSQATA